VTSYRDAGVDLDAADAVVDSIGAAVTATWGPNVVGGFGGFAGGFKIPAGYTNPVLMMSTDGIGTKLDLARRFGIVDGLGFDLVAMVIDDLAAAGAEPIALTDYIAVGRLDPAEITRLVESIARACQASNVALIGGETAEHPGTLPPDSLDVAACALGVIEEADMFDYSTITPGDAVVGVGSPNLRSNGFSLVRAIVGDEPEDIEIEGTALAECLVSPSVLYASAAIAARRLVKGYVHVTGGGIDGNLPRILGAELGALISEDAWPTPAVFGYLEQRGPVSRSEMRQVFNMGIGFIAVCDIDRVDSVIDAFVQEAHHAYRIGTITDEPGVGYETSTPTA
jgi:phosphoribosylformylglycinamidine cyclo-ligase